jgi:hypothetical protein
VYFDTAYIAKTYLDEPESAAIRRLARQMGPVSSSALAIVELHCVLHRGVREKSLSARNAKDIAEDFALDVKMGLWRFLPMPEGLLWRTGSTTLSAPGNFFLRAADAVHLVTARELGETEIWTNDRHMSIAAPWFGLTARSV